MIELAGKVAVVTGGSGGIGAAICRRLAEEGVAVAVGYGWGSDAPQRVTDEIGSAAALSGRTTQLRRRGCTGWRISGQPDGH